MDTGFEKRDSYVPDYSGILPNVGIDWQKYPDICRYMA
jgi:hypothetical protein